LGTFFICGRGNLSGEVVIAGKKTKGLKGGEGHGGELLHLDREEVEKQLH